MSDRPTAYWEYINVEALLGLQSGLASSDDALSNDELMFIVVHQIDELWFKLVLRELATARDFFAQEYVPDTALAAAVRGLDRTTEILRQLADHFRLMESMTTRDYLEFRDKLYPASGFQSAQLREMEILLGLDQDERIPLGHESYMAALRRHDGGDSPALRRVEARLRDTPSLHDAVSDWLYRTPIEGSLPHHEDDADRVCSFVERYLEALGHELGELAERAAGFALTEPDQDRIRARYEKEVAGARAHLLAADVAPDERPRRMRTRAAILFIESYREHPLLAWPRTVIDSIVALEQAFVVFRQRHARMVERIIGRRTGTGGSAGVDYLDRTALAYRIFRELWATRTLLVRKAALPEIEGAETYAFTFPGASAAGRS